MPAARNSSTTACERPLTSRIDANTWCPACARAWATSEGKPAYAVKLLSTQSEREVSGRDGLTITHCVPYAEHTGPIDTLVVIGGQESPHRTPSRELIRWIRKRAAQARRVVSVCTGAFALAPTGLLDGKRVTTHWHHAPKLAQRFPKLTVEKDKIFIKDGRIYTTAGVTAGIDMALALVEEDFGHKAVAAIAHTMVLYVRRPGNESIQYAAGPEQVRVPCAPSCGRWSPRCPAQ